jgi:hypothetical protein
VVKKSTIWDIALCLTRALTLVSCSAYFLALKMEAIFSSETLVTIQRTTRIYTTEYDTLHKYRCENLKSYKVYRILKSTVFWDITACSPLRVNRRFGGTFSLHFQGRRISRALFATYFHACFLLGLLFVPEYVGYIFL